MLRENYQFYSMGFKNGVAQEKRLKQRISLQDAVDEIFADSDSEASEFEGDDNSDTIESESNASDVTSESNQPEDSDDDNVLPIDSASSGSESNVSGSTSHQ